MAGRGVADSAPVRRGAGAPRARGYQRSSIVAPRQSSHSARRRKEGHAMHPTTETPTHDARPNRVVAEFNAMADTFDTHRFLHISAHRLVDQMTLPAGAQVLDVATGTGWAALAAAQRVGPT